MSNMSYCHFRNTYHDLGDCGGHILDSLEGDEAMYRVWLVEDCIRILEALGCQVVDAVGKDVDPEDADGVIKDAIAELPNPETDEED